MAATETEVRLNGLCYSDGALYVRERWKITKDRSIYSLAVYRIQSDITLLDRLKLEMSVLWYSVSPRVDRHSQHVFVPCRDSGVTVVRLDRDRLVRKRTLTCVKDAVSVDVMSTDNAYVGDYDSESVHVVDIINDRITLTLEKPDIGKDNLPHSLAVLGDSIMVAYGYTDPTLVVYRHGSPAPVRVIPRPGGLQELTVVSTDCHSLKFLLTDNVTNSVFVIDENGELHHRVNIDTESSTLSDCAVVNRQLWVGCYSGDIIMMSSQ